MVSASAMLVVLAIVAALPSLHAQNSCTSLTPQADFAHTNGTLIVRNTTNPYNQHGVVYQVDPWIQPSCSKNKTTGAVTCNCNNTHSGSSNQNFLDFPTIYATCYDAINFTMRAVKSGLRVHGVYLIDPDFVDDEAPLGYRCPSPCTDVQYRNYNTSKSAGRCRADSIDGFYIDGKLFRIEPSGECSGYLQLYDGALEVYAVPDAQGSCSTSAIKVNGTCKSVDNVLVSLESIAKAVGLEGDSGTVVFSCPNISGNQPGGLTSHCDDGMALVVQLDCTDSQPPRSLANRNTNHESHD